MSHTSIDEGLLLTFLQQDAHSHGTVSEQINGNGDNDDADDDPSEIAADFSAEIQDFSKDAAAAIQDLQAWMMQYDARGSSHGGSDDPTATFDYDDDSDEYSSDASSTTSQDVQSLCQELQMLDALMRDDPETLSRELGFSSSSSPSRRMPEQAPPESASPRVPPQLVHITLDLSWLEENSVAIIREEAEGDNSHEGKLVHGNDSAPDYKSTKCTTTTDSNKKESRLLFQFTGKVGRASRSIRTAQPLPRPTAMTEKQVKRLKRKHRAFWKRALYRITFGKSRGNKNDRTTSSSSTAAAWVPFVQPFVSQRAGRYCSTPRLISYFEIEILEPQQQQAVVDNNVTNVTKPDSADDPETSSNTGNNKAECIVIGMSTDGFQADQRFPGWDAHSFGYHGDDGSLFFNASQDIRNCGLRFGIGDVVGCGIDYRTAQVFYTHNGKFLGYGLKLNSDHLTTMGWHPTVGLDSHAVVACNFGDTRPFVYDLETMCEIGKQV